MSLLPYEADLYERVTKEDALVIFARGLGYENVVVQLLRLYCSSSSLVLVLGSLSQEQRWFIQQIAPLENMMPKVITNETPTRERETLYKDGGVIFVTPRILVVDVLLERLPIANISGFIVLHAHKVTDRSTISFVMRLYRQKNRTGFVRAFSDFPERFAKGFSTVQRVMKCCFITKLHIRPRFHVNVKECLSKTEPHMIELRVDYSPTMIDIQSSLNELCELCFLELKRLSPILNIQDLTSDTGNIVRNAHHFIRQQLDT